ncbi:MAG: CxxxxCH/CxxCH domain-containing protein [Ignavibacteriae bacterium]|nr:CxxxxCH/CxxCH domain-containing protein [Ignavibacteriota bacterium]
MKTTRLTLIAVGFALLAGCSSELKDELPTTPEGLRPHPANFIPPSDVDPAACTNPACHASIPSPHPSGYITFASPDFHGKDLASKSYNMNSCGSCHATDFTGGWTKKSCSTSGCHIQADGGPTACYTCHGDFVTKKPYPVTVGAHTTHLEGAAGSATVVACVGCHTVPTVWNAAGHLEGSNPNGAEVAITDVMAATKTKGTTGTPSYDPTAGSCANVYCHGNFTNGNNASPTWSGGSDQAKCGTCHGNPATGNPLPKAPHPAVETCNVCHAGVVDANKQIIDKTKHINGKLDSFGSQRTDW